MALVPADGSGVMLALFEACCARGGSSRATGGSICGVLSGAGVDAVFPGGSGGLRGCIDAALEAVGEEHGALASQTAGATFKAFPSVLSAVAERLHSGSTVKQARFRFVREYVLPYLERLEEEGEEERAEEGKRVVSHPSPTIHSPTPSQRTRTVRRGGGVRGDGVEGIRGAREGMMSPGSRKIMSGRGLTGGRGRVVGRGEESGVVGRGGGSGGVVRRERGEAKDAKEAIAPTYPPVRERPKQTTVGIAPRLEALHRGASERQRRLEARRREIAATQLKEALAGASGGDLPGAAGSEQYLLGTAAKEVLLWSAGEGGVSDGAFGWWNERITMQQFTACLRSLRLLPPSSSSTTTTTTTITTTTTPQAQTTPLRLAEAWALLVEGVREIEGEEGDGGSGEDVGSGMEEEGGSVPLWGVVGWVSCVLAIFPAVEVEAVIGVCRKVTGKKEKKEGWRGGGVELLLAREKERQGRRRVRREVRRERGGVGGEGEDGEEEDGEEEDGDGEEGEGGLVLDFGEVAGLIGLKSNGVGESGKESGESDEEDGGEEGALWLLRWFRTHRLATRTKGRGGELIVMMKKKKKQLQSGVGVLSSSTMSSVSSSPPSSTFQPKLDGRSLRMAEKAQERVAPGVPREELLLRYADEVERRRRQQRAASALEEIRECSFRPDMSATKGYVGETGGMGTMGAVSGVKEELEEEEEVKDASLRRRVPSSTTTSLAPGIAIPSSRLESRRGVVRSMRLYMLHKKRMRKMEERVKEEQKRKEEEEGDECTFRPVLNPTIPASSTTTTGRKKRGGRGGGRGGRRGGGIGGVEREEEEEEGEEEDEDEDVDEDDAVPAGYRDHLERIEKANKMRKEAEERRMELEKGLVKKSAVKRAEDGTTVVEAFRLTVDYRGRHRERRKRVRKAVMEAHKERTRLGIEALGLGEEVKKGKKRSGGRKVESGGDATMPTYSHTQRPASPSHSPHSQSQSPSPSRSPSPPLPPPPTAEAPLVFVDLQLAKGMAERIALYRGTDTAAVARKVAKKHALSRAAQRKLLNLLNAERDDAIARPV